MTGSHVGFDRATARVNNAARENQPAIAYCRGRVQDVSTPAVAGGGGENWGWAWGGTALTAVGYPTKPPLNRGFGWATADDQAGPITSTSFPSGSST